MSWRFSTIRRQSCAPKLQCRDIASYRELAGRWPQYNLWLRSFAIAGDCRARDRGRMLLRALVSAILLVVSAAATAQTAQPGWIADSRSGCRVWNPFPKQKESITWSGACQNGLAQGRGILQWLWDNQPGSRYEGELRDGKFNGRGVFTDANGRYEGELRDGQPNGRGGLVWANGRYEGGVLHGRLKCGGVYVWPNGD